jgi:beta-lactam-binding protein with PASTA domain/tRNA A-37 threonylcarbamoyl transferase component Bud32
MPQPEVFSDRYELVEHIARGGMAQVYLAQDLLLDRPVAIKVLFPELSVDPSFVQRFRREAQAAANLAHPNIVAIYDWGQGEHTYFIVMEYVDGSTLSSIIRQAPIGVGRAALVGADVASALEFAHRRGVIHRDVKPGNVLIDHSGQVKVTDFGIARAVGAREGLTQTGAVMGTATYFSPEQAQGYPVDARSDVYALGVVLYEMVAGRPPFAGDNPVAIAYKHVKEEPERLASIQPAVPPDFEAIVAKAMAKDPEDRYPSAEELRLDLMRFHDGAPVLATLALQEPPVTRMVPATAAARRYAEIESMEDTMPPDGGLPYDESPSRSGWWVTLLLVLLAVLAVLIFFIGRSAGWWSSTPTAAIPNVINQPEKTALSALSARGFADVTTKTESSGTVGQGVVISVDPKAGTRLATSSPVILDVSSGPPQVAVPSETGKTVSQADQDLQSHGFRPQNQGVVSTQPINTVLSTSPAAGQMAAQNGVVTVSYSSGPASTSVPNVSGLSVQAAEAALTQSHLQYALPLQDESSATIQPGLVTRTSPAANQSVPDNTPVTIYVSAGPKTSTVPVNLTGLPLATAEEELQANGLTAQVQYQATSDPALNDTVEASNPHPGDTVKSGTTVILFVFQYTAPSTTTTSVPSSTTTASGTTTTSTTASSTTTTTTTS